MAVYKSNRDKTGQSSNKHSVDEVILRVTSIFRDFGLGLAVIPDSGFKKKKNIYLLHSVKKDFEISFKNNLSIQFFR